MFKKIMTGGYPLNWPFIMDNGSGEPTVIAFLEDAEGDILQIHFTPEKDLEIQTEDFAHICLMAEQLKLMNAMLTEANILWRKLDKYWQNDTWHGWENLATQPEVTDQN
ncbi:MULTISPECIES: hypothetical protein [Pseudochrobactrum]|uniref:hypothetical protein n=1 Tax=Pseudochrobactrum TaxID=354349 RepID=UPI0003B49C02|nr:hypothetical protein [Pseudochrobactrum sp. AO18b]